MARPSARRRSAGSARPSSYRDNRRGSSSTSSQQALLIGALGLLVLVLVVVFATNSSNARAGDGSSAGSSTGSGSSASPSPPATKPVSVPASGKAGRTPDRPAPPLTTETLTKLDELHLQAVEHYNDSVRARHAGDNSAAREAAGRAKQVLDQWRELVLPNLRWQEYADMEDWAQPAEYSALERRFQKYAELNKKVRMGGG